MGKAMDYNPEKLLRGLLPCLRGAKIHVRRLRACGEVTFFGCAICEACGAEIPKPKRFCSKACNDIYEKCCVAVAEFFQTLTEED